MLLDATLSLLRQICQERASLLFPIKGNKNAKREKDLVKNCVSVIRTTAGEERCSLRVLSVWKDVQLEQQPAVCHSVFVGGIAGNGNLPAYAACFPSHLVKKLPWLLHNKFFMLPLPEAAG